MVEDKDAVLLIRYNGSPYCMKMEASLAYRQHILAVPRDFDLTLRAVDAPYYQINLPATHGDRPWLDNIGLTDRRTPKLCIGREVFFDSHSQLKELEKRGCAKNGKSVQPWGAPTLYGEYSIEGEVFWTSVRLLPDSHLVPSFIEERKKHFGVFQNMDEVYKGRPLALERLQTLLVDIEYLCTKRTSSTPFLMDQSTPTALDFAMYGVFWLVGEDYGTEDFVPAYPFDKKHSKSYPALSEYLQFIVEKVNGYKKANPPKVIELDDFASFFLAGNLPSLPQSVPYKDFEGHQQKLGKEVAINGKDLKGTTQKGILEYIDAERMALKITDPQSKTVYRAWAPRKYYDFSS